MRRFLQLLVLILPIVAVSSPARAQQTDFEGWFQFVTNVGLDPDRSWVWTLEDQPRLGDDWKKLNTNIIRTYVTYNIDRNFGVSIGYLWGPTFYNSKYQSVYRDENRTFLQLGYKHDGGGIWWYHRYRQEQRFIENTDGAVSNRARYLLRGSYPLAADEKWGLTGYNEIFVNFNGVPNGPTGGYDQDRIFFGPYLIVDNARYEVGFLEQHTQRFGLEPRWAQVLMFMVSVDY